MSWANPLLQLSQNGWKRDGWVSWVSIGEIFGLCMNFIRCMFVSINSLIHSYDFCCFSIHMTTTYRCIQGLWKQDHFPRQSSPKEIIPNWRWGYVMKFALPKTTIAPQKESSLPTTIFSEAMSVSGRVSQCHPSPFPPAHQNKWPYLARWWRSQQNRTLTRYTWMICPNNSQSLGGLHLFIHIDLVFDTQASENMWVHFFSRWNLQNWSFPLLRISSSNGPQF